MSTISIPLPMELQKSLNNLINSGYYGSTKSEVVRRAILELSEKEAVEAVLRAQREIRLGKGIKGDLYEIAKNF